MDSNITIRKKIRRSSSESNIEILANSSDDLLLHSTFLDSTIISTHSERQISINQELKEELESVRQKLRSADIEIDNLSSENNKLKLTIQEQLRQIELLKNVTKESTTAKTCVTPRSKQLTEIKPRTPTTSHIHLTKNASLTVIDTPIKEKRLLHSNNKPQTNRDRKATNQQGTLHDSADSILANNKNCVPDKNKQEKSSHGTAAEITQNTPKHQVLILADNQGQHVRKRLQTLLGSEYHVMSFVKPNASLEHVTSPMKAEIMNLTMNDYVILIAGSNDKNPYKFSSYLNAWLSSITNTNVIISEIAKNYFLHKNKLNYNLKLQCYKYNNVSYADMNFSGTHLYYKIFPIHIARNLLREILRISYQKRMRDYITNNNINKKVSVRNASSQTAEDIISCHICNLCNNHFNVTTNDQITNNSKENIDINPISDTDCIVNSNNLFRV